MRLSSFLLGDLGYRNLNCLTLPGAWFHFEKLLLRIKGNRLKFKCFERNKDLFKLCCFRIPKTNKPLKVKHNKEMDCQVVTNGKNMVIFNCDVLEYLKVTDQIFNFVWLDLCSPISLKILDSLKYVVDRMDHDKAIFAINLLAAREQFDILHAMKKMKMNREEFIIENMKSILEPKLKFSYYSKYQDQSPMIQVVFSSKDLTTKYQLINAVREYG